MDKLFKITTDDNIYIVCALNKDHAEEYFVRRVFSEKLDDDLSDLYDIEELPTRIVSVNEVVAGD